MQSKFFFQLHRLSAISLQNSINSSIFQLKIKYSKSNIQSIFFFIPFLTLILKSISKRFVQKISCKKNFTKIFIQWKILRPEPKKIFKITYHARSFFIKIITVQLKSQKNSFLILGQRRGEVINSSKSFLHALPPHTIILIYYPSYYPPPPPPFLLISLPSNSTPTTYPSYSTPTLYPFYSPLTTLALTMYDFLQWKIL